MSMLLCVVVLASFIPWSQSFAETNAEKQAEGQYQELSFFDYGIADGTTVKDGQTYGTATEITNLDGVAVTGNILFQDSSINDLFWWTSVRVGFGSGTNQGGIGVGRQGERIIFYNYCKAGAPDTLREVYYAEHQVQDLDTTAIKVRFTFDYIKNSNDVAITISLNDKEYYNNTLVDGQSLLGTQLLVWARTADISVASVGYKELTFADWNIADGITTAGEQTSGTNSEITNLHKVAFAGKILLKDSVDAPHWNAVRIGFGSGAGQGGIGVFRSGTNIYLYDYTNDGTVSLAEVTQAQHGVTDLDVNAVTIELKFVHLANSTDVAVAFSLNGNSYYAGTLVDGQNLLSNKILIWSRTAVVAVESVGANAFEELTFSDYGMVNGTTETGNQTYGKANMLTDMNGVAFTGKVMLQDSADTPWWNAVRVGFGYETNKGGIGVFRSGTNIYLYDYTNNGVASLAEVTTSQHGVVDLSTTAVTVRFTFRYIEGTEDVIITFSINGTCYYTGIMENGQNLLGNQLLVWGNTAAITVESVGETRAFKELTFSDYNISDGTIEAGTNTDGTTTMVESIDGIAITGNVLLKDSVGVPRLNAVRVGCANEGEPYGIGVFRTGDRIVLWDYAKDPDGWMTEISSADHQIEDLDNTPITIRFTFRYIENTKDVAVTFSLNGRNYYNGVYTDGQTTLGNRVFIWGYDAPVTIASVVPKQVTREDIYHDLRKGEHQIIYEGFFSVNGEDKKSKENLENTGIYTIAYRGEDAIYEQDVIVYRTGQIHENGAENDVRALVKACKAEVDSKADRYVAKAADYNENGLVDDADLDCLREWLITDHSRVWEGDVMPIAGFYGPIASYTSEKYGYTSKDFLKETYFDLIQKCGINLIPRVDADYSQTPENVLRTLELCEQYNIRLFVTDSGLRNGMTEAEMEERMKDYSSYSSFAGIFVADEPEASNYPKEFDGVENVMERPLSAYQKKATKLNRFNDLLGYVNLFPCYSWQGHTVENYKKYVDEYCDTYQNVKVLSFDYYPFDYSKRDVSYKDYFTNLSIIREKAKERGIPYWAFVQCGGYFGANQDTGDLYPTEGEFYWNVNTVLAMGAKGIQYFPLVQPHWFSLTSSGTDPKRSGLIGADGNTTDWYDYATNANKQIAAVDEVLMNAEHLGVIVNAKEEGKKGNFLFKTDVVSVIDHVSSMDSNIVFAQGVDKQYSVELTESFVEGTRATWVDGDITNVNGNALIGCFDYNGKTALYVVNYDMYSEQEISIEFSEVHKLTQISEEGTNIVSTNHFTFTPQKGEAILLVID